MPRKIEQKNDQGGSFECVVPDQLPELYADGVSQIAVGMPITRILFHTVVPSQQAGEKIEQRVAKLSVVIPTAALMELIANIASNTSTEVVKSTNTAISAFTAQTVTQMNRLAALTEGVNAKG
ncbi:hypothetical protein [Pandoraea pnomenusa]|uniref:hypothetical protein n=1 Tax=Pandoraea pnomenusa TaxID=93220 RepID=UPI0007BC9230|nr:hypothetical protein [Pandoraea pnomenusa]ANC46296.1 hypothetical protein A6P55_21050 [Pandoraea pnomenusa]